MQIVLDAACMAQRQEAHAYLAQQLGFPEHYGRNLDALSDCLEELGELKVAFVNVPEEKTYFTKVLRVFRDAAKRGGIRICAPENLLPGGEATEET